MKQYQSNVDIIGIIEGLNNQLKCITKAITEIYSSDNELVLSQKKEQIIKILNSKEYKEQQEKVELILKLSQQYNYPKIVEYIKKEEESMEIDSVQAQIALCKRGIEQRDSELNLKKQKENHE